MQGKRLIRGGLQLPNFSENPNNVWKWVGGVNACSDWKCPYWITLHFFSKVPLRLADQQSSLTLERCIEVRCRVHVRGRGSVARSTDYLQLSGRILVLCVDWKRPCWFRDASYFVWESLAERILFSKHPYSMNGWMNGCVYLPSTQRLVSDICF